jgi:hypothetical protein
MLELAARDAALRQPFVTPEMKAASLAEAGAPQAPTTSAGGSEGVSGLALLVRKGKLAFDMSHGGGGAGAGCYVEMGAPTPSAASLLVRERTALRQLGVLPQPPRTQCISGAVPAAPHPLTHSLPTLFLSSSRSPVPCGHGAGFIRRPDVTPVERPAGVAPQRRASPHLNQGLLLRELDDQAHCGRASRACTCRGTLPWQRVLVVDTLALCHSGMPRAAAASCVGRALRGACARR